MERKHMRITVEGVTYDVTTELIPEAGHAAAASPPAMVPPPVAAAPSPAPKPSGDGILRSPLAGKLVSFDVTKGQTVSLGDRLAVIEAMKMNTYVHATANGTVAELLAQAGDGVEEGQPLLRIL